MIHVIIRMSLYEIVPMVAKVTQRNRTNILWYDHVIVWWSTTVVRWPTTLYVFTVWYVVTSCSQFTFKDAPGPKGSKKRKGQGESAGPEKSSWKRKRQRCRVHMMMRSRPFKEIQNPAYSKKKICQYQAILLLMGWNQHHIEHVASIWIMTWLMGFIYHKHVTHLDAGWFCGGVGSSYNILRVWHLPAGRW